LIEKAKGRSLSQFLAEITHCDGYQGLIAAMRARAEELRIATGGESVAEVAGLPRGYLQRILGPQQKPATEIRRIGAASLGPILGVLGIKLIVVEDHEALGRYVSRLQKRQEGRVHSGTVHVLLSGRFMQEIRRKGGENSRKYISKTRARQIARKAAKARWRRQTNALIAPNAKR
jgi:hypothetical protein